MFGAKINPNVCYDDVNLQRECKQAIRISEELTELVLKMLGYVA